MNFSKIQQGVCSVAHFLLLGTNLWCGIVSGNRPEEVLGKFAWREADSEPNGTGIGIVNIGM